MDPEGRLVLRVSPRKAVAVLLACIGLAVAGLCLPSGGRVGWLEGACALFFGGGALCFVFRALDRRPQVVLDDEGLFDRRLRVGPVPWERIEGAALVRVYGSAVLCLRVDAVERLAPGRERRWRAASRAGRRLGLGDLCVGLDGLDARPEEVLRRVRARIGGGRLPPDR